MQQDPIKHTKFITLISLTIFLGIVSLISLIFIIKLRKDPNFLNKQISEKIETKETTESINETNSLLEEEKVKSIDDINFEEEFTKIQIDTLDKVVNVYNENELDEF